MRDAVRMVAILAELSLKEDAMFLGVRIWVENKDDLLSQGGETQPVVARDDGDDPQGKTQFP